MPGQASPHPTTSSSGAPELTGLEIAVIGMAGRFPAAGNIEEFWENLKAGREATAFFSEDELKRAGVETRLSSQDGFVKAKLEMPDKDCFDESFFGYTPREAEVMTPQVRVFYECAWSALEDAGYDPGAYPGSIGCYAGSSSSFEWQLFAMVSGKTHDMDGLAATLLSDKDTLSSRLAYKLDLKGPGFTLHTACSTSLLAIHLACRGLLTNECGMALAGGVALSIAAKPGYLTQEGMIFSLDGHNRAFDARASGTAFGEGVGIVVLKRYPEAVKDGDHIYALVKGSAINNDGSLRVGYTAPGTLGQREVIKKAQKVARVTPDSISYVETHGTGTILGDPMEIEALKQAFNTGKTHVCALGAVKSNVGHLDIAAGVTGFIKTVLALKHRLIPPTLHFESPNPKLDLENSPFYVNTTLLEWKNDNGPLRAGVSAFGIGGSNAHVILEEAPKPIMNHGPWGNAAGKGERKYRLILLSAQTPTALERRTENLADYFKQYLLNPGNLNPGPSLADAVYTLQVGRRALRRRRFAVCATAAEAVEALGNPSGSGVVTLSCDTSQAPSVFFLFSGLGSEYVNMGRDLYETEPLFRETADRCFAILKPLLEYDIKGILFPAKSDESDRSDRSEKSDSSDQSDQSNPSDNSDNVGKLDIHRIDVAHLAVFIVEYALARLILHWGITPRAMIGYSFGEYAVACISGVFSLEEALKLVAVRGKLIAGTPPGAMLSLPLPKEQLLPLLPAQVSLAVDNDTSCLVSGPTGAVEILEKQMKKALYLCMRLPTRIGAHSATMDPILEEFTGKAGEIKFKTPTIPYISNVSGTWISEADAADPSYWTAHLRQTVRFADGIKTLVEKEKEALFLEIGPGGDIGTLVRRYLENNPGQQVISLLRNPRRQLPDTYFLLHQVGRLWLYGIIPDWRHFYSHEQRQRISLPTYAFENHRYAAAGDPYALGMKLLEQDVLTKKSSTTDWFYQPSWKRLSLAVNHPGPEPGTATHQQGWLILTGPGTDLPGPVAELVKKLQQKNGARVVTAAPGAEFTRLSRYRYLLDPVNPHHYQRLLTEIRQSGIEPHKILHLGGVSGKTPGMTNRAKERINQAQQAGFYSLLYLARAMGRQGFTGNCEIIVLDNNMQEVVAEEFLCPEKMTLLALVNVIPQEYPGIKCRSIDIDLGSGMSSAVNSHRLLVDQLLAELETSGSDTMVAYRGNQRWVRSFEPLPLGAPGPAALPFRERGVYLISGGLGNIGLFLAEALFKCTKARLVLIGRTPLPPRPEWDRWLETHGSEREDRIGRRIRRLRALEDQGAEILVLTAEVSDEEQMQTALAAAEERFGPIHGVIHGAGIVGPSSIGMIDTLTPAQCQLHFQAKIHALPVLEKLFAHKSIDFCMLMSSISAVLGGLGYAAYSAANLFMDAFVFYHNREHPHQPWVSVNWDGWPPEPGGPEEGKSAAPGSLGAQLVRLTMTAHEAFDAFTRILAQPRLQQVVVSTGTLQTRIDQWIKLEALEEAGDDSTPEPAAATPLQTRPPHLMSTYAAPRTPLEEAIAQVLTNMLGFEPIGIEDDFFELGVDSIKIIQIRARLNKRGYTVDMGDFFQYPTIAQLAPRVRKSAAAGKKDNNENNELIPGLPMSMKVSGLSAEAFDRLQQQYPSPLQDLYPLTPMQEGMLFYSLYERQNTSPFFEQLVYRLQGPLKVSLVEKSVNELIKRHDVLRTAFIHRELERPLQVVLTERPAEFRCEDLRHIVEETGNPRGKDEILEEYRKKDRQKSFDLGKDILMRIAVFRLGEEDYCLLWSFHHILMDGWCIGLLQLEFFEIYYRFLTGRPHPLPPVQPYRTYIQWLESREKALSLLYWRNYLQGYDSASRIPKKRKNNTAARGYGDGEASTLMGQTESDRVKQMAVRAHVTLSTLFQVIWAVVLGRYTGKEDIVFGLVVSGRPAEIPGVEAMIGCFVNSVPVRVRYNPGTTFIDLLKTVQRLAIESEPHHYCSLAEIQAESLLKNELLDHIIDFQNFPAAQQVERVLDRVDQTGKVGGETPASPKEDNNQVPEEPIKISHVKMFEQSNYDFNLVVIPGDQIALSIAFNTNVYEERTIGQMGGHCLRVLEQVLDNEEITIAEISFLSTREESQLLERLRPEAQPPKPGSVNLPAESPSLEAEFNF
jgi:acyl transferase domain-containing protein/aryl carrier-like protein